MEVSKLLRLRAVSSYSWYEILIYNLSKGIGIIAGRGYRCKTYRLLINLLGFRVIADRVEMGKNTDTQSMVPSLPRSWAVVRMRYRIKQDRYQVKSLG